MRILIIEDEPRMLELLRKGLYECGFTVMATSDGEDGRQLALQYHFDAILLDIGLPGLNGFDLTRSLRANQCLTPVLMLTARDAEDDIIRGLEFGADDYMTKPFSFLELVARLQSITRHLREEPSGVIEFGDMVIDSVRHTFARGEETIPLTRQEFALMSCLVRAQGHCVLRETLMKAVWGADYEVGPGALDVLVNALRGKVDLPARQKHITTIRGAGYALWKLPTAFRSGAA